MDADDRANELYWGSDQSVNQIAADLDLSKGSLYEMIRPLPAGFYCPSCQAEVVHSNRTARDRGRVDCPACGWDGVEEDASPFGATEAEGASDAVDDVYSIDDYHSAGPPPAGVATDASGSRLIVGGALVGAAVGLALVIWARRR